MRPSMPSRSGLFISLSVTVGSLWRNALRRYELSDNFLAFDGFKAGIPMSVIVCEDFAEVWIERCFLALCVSNGKHRETLLWRIGPGFLYCLVGTSSEALDKRPWTAREAREAPTTLLSFVLHHRRTEIAISTREARTGGSPGRHLLMPIV